MKEKKMKCINNWVSLVSNEIFYRYGKRVHFEW